MFDEKVPEWARTWCYYFAFVAVIVLCVGTIGLFYSKSLGLPLTLLYFAASLVQAATAMTLFWMCRKTL